MGAFAKLSVRRGHFSNFLSPDRSIERHQQRSWQHTAVGLAVAATAVGTLLVSSLPYASGSITAKKGTESPLKKGLAYYQGKTVQFLLNSGTGSVFDQQYRPVIAAMGSYLHANFEMVDNPAGAGITAEDDIAAASKDGLTFGLLNISGIFFNDLTGAPSVNFNPAKEVWIGKHDSAPTVLYTQSNSPYQSVAALRGTTTTNPVKMVETAGLAALLSELTTKVFGIHASYVQGYSSSTSELTGFLRGDGQLYPGSVASLVANVVAHAVTPLIVWNFGTSLKPYTTPGFTTYENVPTIQQLLVKYPPKTALEKKAAKVLMTTVNFPQNVIALPSRTPPDLVAAMDAAYKYAMTTPAVKTEFQISGDVPKIQDGATVLAAWTAGIKSEKGIQSVLGINS